MLGRLMSFVMFASLGLMPLPQAPVGRSQSLGLVQLFAGAGVLLTLGAPWLALAMRPGVLMGLLLRSGLSRMLR